MEWMSQVEAPVGLKILTTGGSLPLRGQLALSFFFLALRGSASFPWVVRDFRVLAPALLFQVPLFQAP